jgi:hypothetical protein
VVFSAEKTFLGWKGEKVKKTQFGFAKLAPFTLFTFSPFSTFSVSFPHSPPAILRISVLKNSILCILSTLCGKKLSKSMAISVF